MTQYTQGPLHVTKHGTPKAHPQFGIYAEGCRNDHVIVKGENAEADAYLYAAAPDMREALDEIADTPINVDGYNSAEALRLRMARMHTLAREAIARTRPD